MSVKPIVEFLRPEVIAFAQAMQFKLEQNSKKKGWPEQDENGDRGWKSCSPMFLEGKLREEVRELLDALLVNDKEAILFEAADVGNIAMMLADNANALEAARSDAATQANENSQNGTSTEQTSFQALERELEDARAQIAELKRSEFSRAAELMRGEFICKKCGLRKDAEFEKGDF